MVGWRLLAPLSLILLHLSLANPQCVICTSEGAQCEALDSWSQPSSTNVTISCSGDVTENVNGTSTATNLTRVNDGQKTSSTDIMDGELLFHNRTIFANVRYLNFSHNNIDSFNSIIDSMIGLDLSHNVISNISRSQFLSPNLAHLVLSNNKIVSLCNFSHSALQYLDANRNKITKLCLGEFPKLKYLNLGENEISKIDPSISSQVPRLEIFNLSTNAIAQLNDFNFNLSSLLRLYLGNNKITYLSEKCFYGLNRLQFLDISDNRVTTVFPSMFQYIPLVQLVISNNPDLMTQDFGILLASERLKNVNASSTNQNKIPACLTRSVRYLSLSHNKISQIQCGDLDSYPLLNSLDLSYNNISFIEDDALGRLELLETIILSHNRLTFIPYTLPNNLKSLKLSHNYLSKLTPSDFTGLLKLKHLDLSESNMNSIADGSFSQMYGLVSLNLSTNPLQVVSIGTFAGPHKLKTLDLSGLSNVTKCNQDLCFPVPEPNELSELHIEGSPELGHRLLNDAAAMKTFKQLNVLNMENCNLTDIDSEVSNYFPRLRNLYLGGNDLNCSKIQELYVWSDVTEVAECTFVINEKVTTTVPAWTMSSNSPSQFESATNLTTLPTASSSSEVPLEAYVMNNSLRYSQEVEVVSNEIWIPNDQLGNVDAYSAEAPSSHPGLFAMLVVPITLAVAILFIHYSRLKKIRTQRRCEMDIEISNISSELW